MKSSVSARFNADLLDQKYEQWCDDPQSVEADWCAFFEGFEIGNAQLKQSDSTTTKKVSSDPNTVEEEYLNFRGNVETSAFPSG